MIRDTEEATIRRQLDVDTDCPGAQVAQAVADLKGVDCSETTPIYDCVDSVLDHLFSEPPSPEAEMEVAFNYEGYRVFVDQDAHAQFVEIE